jgi:hypothetical protein
MVDLRGWLTSRFLRKFHGVDADGPAWTRIAHTLNLRVGGSIPPRLTTILNDFGDQADCR